MTPVTLASLAAVAVFLVFAGAAVWQRGAPLRARLRALGGHVAGGDVAVRVFRDDGPRHLLERLLFALGRRQVREEESDEATAQARRKVGPRQVLVYAGFRRPSAIVMLMGTRAVLAVALGCLAAPAALALGKPPIGGLLGGVAVGFVLPGVFVARLAAWRQTRIRRALPDILDLLLLCVEAGLGLNAALARVTDERSETGKDPLTVELRMVSQELSVGAARRAALRNFADRTGLDEIRMLAAQLVQAERLGASIGAALRAQSDMLRTRRRLEAEEQANKTQVKLLFPLVLLILPALFIVIGAPAVISIMTNL